MHGTFESMRAAAARSRRATAAHFARSVDRLEEDGGDDEPRRRCARSAATRCRRRQFISPAASRFRYGRARCVAVYAVGARGLFRRTPPCTSPAALLTYRSPRARYFVYDFARQPFMISEQRRTPNSRRWYQTRQPAGARFTACRQPLR